MSILRTLLQVKALEVKPPIGKPTRLYHLRCWLWKHLGRKEREKWRYFTKQDTNAINQHTPW